jgi:uridine kinase
MGAKLTLTLDPRIIERAKRYARQQGRSLSNLIEDYLKLVTEPEQHHRVAEPPAVYTPKTQTLYGILHPLEENFDRKKVLEDELIKKYG